MKWIVVIAFAVGACGKRQDENKQKAEDLAHKVEDKAKGLGDQAKGLGEKIVDKTKDVAGDVATKATDLSKDALATGRKVKAELEKVYKSTTDYDITVDATPEAAADHDARLAGMPSVAIGSTKIGYEQDSATSLFGMSYKRHFRATWRALDGRTVRLSFYTQEELDLPAFARLLEKIVPLASMALK